MPKHSTVSSTEAAALLPSHHAGEGRRLTAGWWRSENPKIYRELVHRCSQPKYEREIVNTVEHEETVCPGFQLLKPLKQQSALGREGAVTSKQVGRRRGKVGGAPLVLSVSVAIELTWDCFPKVFQGERTGRGRCKVLRGWEEGERSQRARLVSFSATKHNRLHQRGGGVGQS